MTANKDLKPTQGELKILHILWEQGASTVREVHRLLHEPEGRSYTTTLKQLQVMEQKGLVRRDTSQRSHVYSAAMAQQQAQRRLVDDLVETVFGGSAERLMVHLLESKRSGQMLEEVQRLIEAKERHEHD